MFFVIGSCRFGSALIKDCLLFVVGFIKVVQAGFVPTIDYSKKYGWEP